MRVALPARPSGTALLLATLGCAGGGELIVLAPDPEDGSLGRATVTAAGAVVELTGEGEGTRVSPGDPPASPEQIPPSEVERVFGAALEARPLRPRAFLLYFELGSDSLSAESAQLLPEIVATARSRPGADLSIIGHTDTTGDARANYELGLRRADLVLSALVQAGIDPSQVEVKSHGEADPLVSTPDDTAEARNRRVEVTIR